MVRAYELRGERGSETQYRGPKKNIVFPDPFPPQNLEERMRVEMPVASQPLVEAPKNIDKKEVTGNSSEQHQSPEESQSFVPSPLGFSGTYSVSSLKAAVDYHAKFLTVAESNLEAARHTASIPQALLDRLNGRGIS
jgi:hypothetical protein